jgi:hypothetical protein
MIKDLNSTIACLTDPEPVENLYNGLFEGAMRRNFVGTTLPDDLTTAGRVEQLVDYVVLYTDSAGDQCVSHGESAAADISLKVKDNNVDLSKGVGVTLIKGWVDYVPVEA